MNWFHCNVCTLALDLTGPGMPSASSCGHIYCSNCTSKVVGACPICQQHIQVNCLWDDQGVVFNQLESFFKPSDEIVSQMQMYIRSLQYQLRNYSSLIVNLREKHQEMQVIVHKAKQELVDRKTLQAEVIRLRQLLNTTPQHNNPHFNHQTPLATPSKDFKRVNKSVVGNKFVIDATDENSDFSMRSESKISKNPFYK